MIKSSEVHYVFKAAYMFGRFTYLDNII